MSSGTHNSWGDENERENAMERTPEEREEEKRNRDERRERRDERREKRGRKAKGKNGNSKSEAKKKDKSTKEEKLPERDKKEKKEKKKEKGEEERKQELKQKQDKNSQPKKRKRAQSEEEKEKRATKKKKVEEPPKANPKPTTSADQGKERKLRENLRKKGGSSSSSSPSSSPTQYPAASSSPPSSSTVAPSPPQQLPPCVAYKEDFVENQNIFPTKNGKCLACEKFAAHHPVRPTGPSRTKGKARVKSQSANNVSSTNDSPASQLHDLISDLNANPNCAFYVGKGATQFTDDLLDKKGIPQVKASWLSKEFAELGELRFLGGKGIFDDVQDLTEDNLQKVLTSKAKEAAWRAVDTHASLGVCFKHGRSIGGREVFTRSGKPDLSSTVRKMYFEVKGVKEDKNMLLLQMSQRVNTALTLNHTLRNSVAFGAVGKECFLMVGSVEWPKMRAERSSTIRLFRIKDNCVETVWCWLSRLEPFTDMVREGQVLWSMIQQLFQKSPNDICSVAPHLTRIRYLGSSEHRVFEIVLPTSHAFDNDGKKLTQLAIDKNEESTIAVKVFCGDMDRFEREQAALHAVSLDYFLASWTPRRGFQSPKGTLNDLVPARAVLERVWGLKVSTGQASPRCNDVGLLLMRVGQPVERDVFKESQFRDEVRESLIKIHTAGWVHCDCRLNNVLWFPTLHKHSLVDLDHARECAKPIVLRNERNGRMPYYPLPIWKQLEGKEKITVEWGEKEDVEMLWHCFMGPREIKDSFSH